MNTLLIVEDNTSLRETLRDSFEENLEGIEVHEAASGPEAEDLFARKRPALVLMDINIPSPTGLVVTRKIKERSPECVVIILSNHDSIEYRAAAENCGADYFFSKQSSTMNDLVTLARNLMKTGRHPHE